MLVRGSVHDHPIFKILGTPPHGLVVEETAKQRQAGTVIVNKTELLEVSDQPLDEALFEVPPDYVPQGTAQNAPLARLESFSPMTFIPITFIQASLPPRARSPARGRVALRAGLAPHKKAQPKPRLS